jgi:hypothetical protein
MRSGPNTDPCSPCSWTPLLGSRHGLTGLDPLSTRPAGGHWCPLFARCNLNLLVSWHSRDTQTLRTPTRRLPTDKAPTQSRRQAALTPLTNSIPGPGQPALPYFYKFHTVSQSVRPQPRQPWPCAGPHLPIPGICVFHCHSRTLQKSRETQRRQSRGSATRTIDSLPAHRASCPAEHAVNSPPRPLLAAGFGRESGRVTSQQGHSQNWAARWIVCANPRPIVCHHPIPSIHTSIPSAARTAVRLVVKTRIPRHICPGRTPCRLD